MSSHGAVVTPGIEAVFAKEELLTRQQRARTELQTRGIDILLLTGPENIFYLTGQQTPGYYTYQALLLPVDSDPVFIVRQLELNNLVANSYLQDIVPFMDNADPVEVTIGVVKQRGWQDKRFAIDQRGWFLPIAIYKALEDQLEKIGDGSGIVESLRAVKSKTELSKLEQSARYVDAGMRAGLETVAADCNENDIVARMMAESIRAGSEYVGMEPLMASGPRCGIPHGTWRRRKIQSGDPVFLEMAASHDRYHAALMRSAWIGQPPAVARSMMDCCLQALEAALDSLKPGVTCEDVHNACQKVIDEYGYTENFKKRTGYSVGISFAPDWGEGNVLSLYTGVETVVQPGMVFHLPPALRIYGEFTVGVSEVAIVTSSGCRTLSTIDRDLMCV